VGNKAVAVTDLLRSPSLLTNCRLINSRLTNSLLPNILLTNNMSTSSVFLISDAPCYSSVVITVFMIGIFDSFFFTVMLSVTNQGEISSRLVLALLLFVFLIVSLLLMMFELLPFVSSCLLSPLLFIALFNEFLLFTELDFDKLVARTGKRLDEVGCFLPTLDNDLVTGWLDENDVSILLSIACELLTTGSMLASGEFVGEPEVDIGESVVVDVKVAVVIGGTTGSKNGFFDFVGEENGLDRPIVANFCPANGLFCWLVLFAWWPLLAVDELVEVVVGVGK